MNIVYISDSAIPFDIEEDQNAESIFVMKMCEAFAKNGHEVTLIARNFKDLTVDERIFNFYGVKQCFKIILIKRLNFRGKNLFSLIEINKLIKNLNRHTTLIYSREIYSVSLAQNLGFKVIYESHLLPAHKLSFFLEKRLFKTKELIKFVAISNALKKFYSELYGPIKNIEAHHDAADENNLEDNENYTWPSKRNTLQIGYIGHLYKGRGIDIIMDCAKACPEFDFHIIGGDKRDIDYWYKMKTPNVFFHGFIRPKETPPIRNKCDILLMPYQRVLATAGGRNTSEWMSPMKMFEYMSSKKAIISSDLPVIREVLNDTNSVLVTPDDPNEWIEAIKFLQDEHNRDALANNAYLDYKSKYTWEKRAEKILENVSL